MLIPALLVVVGFVLLIKGADWFVDGASALAQRLRISQIVIGLTVVAFGTSAPELVVNVFASVQGHDGISFGNILGSNLFNILMVLGAVAVIKTLPVDKRTTWREIPISFGVTIVVMLLAVFPTGLGASLSRIDGVILLLMMAGYIYYLRKTHNPHEFEVEDESSLSTVKITVLLLLGLVGLIGGGQLVVDNSVKLARMFNMSEKFIGLTIVALGTSLPELVTSLAAVLKGKNNIAIGNVIGSNIFNLLLVLGVSSLISPIGYDLALNIDFYILLGVTVILFVTMFSGKKYLLGRWEGLLFLLGYVGYTAFLFYRG